MSLELNTDYYFVTNNFQQQTFEFQLEYLQGLQISLVELQYHLYQIFNYIRESDFHLNSTQTQITLCRILRDKTGQQKKDIEAKIINQLENMEFIECFDDQFQVLNQLQIQDQLYFVIHNNGIKKRITPHNHTQYNPLKDSIFLLHRQFINDYLKDLEQFAPNALIDELDQQKFEYKKQEFDQIEQILIAFSEYTIQGQFTEQKEIEQTIDGKIEKVTIISMNTQEEKKIENDMKEGLFTIDMKQFMNLQYLKEGNFHLQIFSDQKEAKIYLSKLQAYEKAIDDIQQRVPVNQSPCFPIYSMNVHFKKAYSTVQDVEKAQFYVLSNRELNIPTSQQNCNRMVLDQIYSRKKCGQFDQTFQQEVNMFQLEEKNDEQKEFQPGFYSITRLKLFGDQISQDHIELVQDLLEKDRILSIALYQIFIILITIIELKEQLLYIDFQLENLFIIRCDWKFNVKMGYNISFRDQTLAQRNQQSKEFKENYFRQAIEFFKLLIQIFQDPSTTPNNDKDDELLCSEILNFERQRKFNDFRELLKRESFQKRDIWLQISQSLVFYSYELYNEVTYTVKPEQFSKKMENYVQVYNDQQHFIANPIVFEILKLVDEQLIAIINQQNSNSKADIENINLALFDSIQLFFEKLKQITDGKPESHMLSDPILQDLTCVNIVPSSSQSSEPLKREAFKDNAFFQGQFIQNSQKDPKEFNLEYMYQRRCIIITFICNLVQPLMMNEYNADELSFVSMYLTESGFSNLSDFNWTIDEKRRFAVKQTYCFNSNLPITPRIMQLIDSAMIVLIVSADFFANNLQLCKPNRDETKFMILSREIQNYISLYQQKAQPFFDQIYEYASFQSD